MLQLKIIGLRLPAMCFDCALYITNMLISRDVRCLNVLQKNMFVSRNVSRGTTDGFGSAKIGLGREKQPLRHHQVRRLTFVNEDET